MKLKGESLFFIGIILVSAAVVVGAVVFSTNGSNGEPTEDLLVKETSYTKGPDNAAVILVEFGDLQCPACKAALPNLKKVEEEYRDEVKFVFRHFPLEVHKNAQSAAQAAEAAGTQGKFWEYHDLLYERQVVWGESTDPRTLFIEYANEIELDVDQFTKDFDNQKYTSRIEEDIRDGKGVGVTSTPTFFLNGEKIVGTPSFEDMQSKIESILNEPS